MVATRQRVNLAGHFSGQVKMTARKHHRVGPSAPVAGLLRRIADARDWTIPPHALPAVLARHRAGSVAATRLLRSAHERHLWRLAIGPDGQPADHLIGHLWLALDAAIASLRTACPDDVDRYISTRMAQAVPSWHLRHRLRWLHEDLPAALVRVPGRTARRRRAAGLPAPLTRSTPRDIAMPRQPDPSLCIDIDAAIDRAGPLARDVVIHIRERGLSAREAAAELGISRHRLRVTLDALSEHLTD